MTNSEVRKVCEDMVEDSAEWILILMIFFLPSLVEDLEEKEGSNHHEDQISNYLYRYNLMKATHEYKKSLSTHVRKHVIHVMEVEVKQKNNQSPALHVMDKEKS